MLLYGPLFKLLFAELEVSWNYIDENLANGLSNILDHLP